MAKIYAVLSDGKVENVILANPEVIEKMQISAVDVTENENRPGPGWLYDGENFVKPVEEIKPEEKAPEITPEEQAKIDAKEFLQSKSAKDLPTGGPELQELLEKLIKAAL